MADARAGRDLVVCCDGTNNTLTAGLQDTNVLLLHAYLRKHVPATTLLYYDPGVGTPDAAPPTGLLDMAKRKIDRIAGLASGRGVYENIAEAYRFLMANWSGPQDRIFCFGFSRGAFTARCVVGMVNMFGMLARQHESLVPTLIRIYFSQVPSDEVNLNDRHWSRTVARWIHHGLARPEKAAGEIANIPEPVVEEADRARLAEQVRRVFASNDAATRATVYWVGVWDTVESVGLPLLGSRDNPATATFHDKPGIKNVRHALAFDEHRLPFKPRLYDAPSRTRTDDGRTLEQLWFPGVHCDVGGSYRKNEAGLSDASLVWMINEVADELRIPKVALIAPTQGQPAYDDFGMPRTKPFPATQMLRHDALWDTPYWALAGMTVRNLLPTKVVTRKDPIGVVVDIAAHPQAPVDGPSVWDRRRPLWTLAAVVLFGTIALGLSGFSLMTAPPYRSALSAADWLAAARSACHFAAQQLAAGPVPAAWLPGACGSVAPTGLRDPDAWAAAVQASPAWAMAWDFVFIACWGYVLARIASRAFAFLAGFRRPGDKLPAWRWLGLAPMIAVVGDVGENVATGVALIAHGLGSPLLVAMLLYLGGMLSIAKLGGLVASLPFLVVRLALAVLPTARVGKVGRRQAVPSLGGPQSA
jgi:uncharacterized protein (DUF2235 family)